ncbi:hypothetical protein MPTK1_8g11900 [Marchantia polymorpha subsp. ruderalis]|uniref:Uncharacterized protein n=1 Tax=Marchantia polymorpha TaxID=3197 RepID=A0A2R6XM86_MARPO|nr:hypothetical protein MARPO_0008s0025 [Marchantia polymorpha]PTQ47238.1 hypothetical protein MARPO_0008s0025 [Marchantia polymorpha]BBN19585.1 hypothetical protein Mp_8g11900 [Marchantia polymorpha subsp. ruderalis]BBN19586.1 hypothetical protein Mp_8g11900 [Marchantia polymorpha subsp. ruderalis]|eukprot:PTQ47237.1 hypothetical protein MARPO_0008s0025 [Marchantia polymorpha]
MKLSPSRRKEKFEGRKTRSQLGEIEQRLGASWTLNSLSRERDGPGDVQSGLLPLIRTPLATTDHCMKFDGTGRILPFWVLELE